MSSLLDSLAAEIRKLLVPLTDVVDNPATLDSLVAEIGASSDNAGGAALANAFIAFNEVVTELESLSGGPSPSLGTIAQLLETSRKAFAAVNALSNAGAPAAALEGFGVDLADFIVVAYLNHWHPLARNLAALLTLLQPAEELPLRPPVLGGTTVLRQPFVLDTFHFERLASLVQDPGGTLKAEYPMALATGAQADALAQKLFPRVLRVLRSLGVSCRFGYSPGDESLLGQTLPYIANALIVYVDEDLRDTGTEAGLIFALSSTDRGGLGLVITPFGSLTNSWQVGDWTLQLSLTAEVQGLAIGSNGVTILAGATTAEIDGKVAATLPPPDSGPAFILGSPTGTRLEIGGANLEADVSVTAATQSYGVTAAVQKAAVVIAPGDGDGFLQSVLPPNGARAEFDLGLAWTNTGGLKVHGAGGLDVTVPAGLSLGPVTVQSIHLGLHADGSGVSAECSAIAGLSLGPVHVLVDRMGLLANLAFPAGGGNLGPLGEGSLAFKSPSGLGLSIDAGVVTGGGFLGFDPAQSQYVGAANLSIEGVGVSALGLVLTQPEVSFLILIATTFPSPIQLGLGFALKGVGGLAGVNRSLSLDALEAAVWKGALQGVLFPTAPITNAAAILNELEALFPAAQGRYVFGPTAEIVWGTPPILTGQVGLVLELPDPVRIALIGSAVAQFPPDKPLVVLKVNFAGGIDFGAGRLFFDASLTGSRIEKYPLSGALSLRSSWQDPKTHALAVGGFNPHFQPPAGFPALDRVALDVSDGPLHLHLAAYLAITSNTFQVGAAVDLKAHVCDCDVAGHFGFDALFIKNPFSFIVDVDASASISFEGETFAAVHVTGSLSGPAPWHAKGSASISLCFFSVGVDFDQTWGSSPPASLPAADPWTTALAPALGDPSSWRGELPAGVFSVVTWADDSSGTVLLDPAAAIVLDEKAVPLDQPIARFGEVTLPSPVEFDLTGPSVNGTAVDPSDWAPATNEFAPAQFSELTDDQKLSAESFVSLHAGAVIAGAAASVGSSVGAALTYQLIVIDSTGKPLPKVLVSGSLAAQLQSAAAGPAARAPLRRQGFGRFAPGAGDAPKAALAPSQYSLVSTANLAPQATGVAATRYQAALALAAYAARHAVGAGQLQAVPALEGT
jgi:hypothetical protein